MRCFIALPLPGEAREELSRWTAAYRAILSESFQAPTRLRQPRLSWTKSNGYHLTLAFLGEIEGPSLELAVAALSAVAGSGVIPFSLAGIGTFPSRGAWRVLFARIADGGGSAVLCERVNEALADGAARAGSRSLAPQRSRRRPFEPHVTLARAGAPMNRDLLRSFSSADAEANCSIPAWAGEIRRCSLYQSELRSAGAVYTELKGAELAR